MTHNIGTPLTVLKCYISILEEKNENNKSIDVPRESIKILSDSTENLIKVVRDFIEVCDVDDNKIMCDIQETTVKQLAVSIEDDLDFKFKSNNILFYKKINDLNKIVLIDRLKINTVIEKIINNSIKYSSDIDGRKITIMIGETGDSLNITIEDNSIRNLPQTTKDLLSKFSDSENQFEADILSNDLSLYISKKIIEKQRGKFLIKQIEQKGLENQNSSNTQTTKFTIILPIHNPKNLSQE